MAVKMTIKEYLTKHFHKHKRVPLIQKCAKALGRSERSVMEAWTKVNKELTGSVEDEKYKYKASNRMPMKRIKDPEEIKKIKELEKQLQIANEKILILSKKNKRATLVNSKSNHIKFALISDTHFGSMCCDEDAFQNFCKYCVDQKVYQMYVSGDILAGGGIYKGQEFELKDHGVELQRDRLMSMKIPAKLKVDFICGNHDTSFRNQVGVSVGDMIANCMPNWTFLGDMQADMHFKTPNGTYKLRLMHPDGGTAYALSYKGQKIVEGLEGGTKPHMLSIGHYHKAEMIPAYRNVAVIQAGAFERQTEFLKRKGSQCHVGGWIMEVNVEKDANRVKGEFINYY